MHMQSVLKTSVAIMQAPFAEDLCLRACRQLSILLHKHNNPGA